MTVYFIGAGPGDPDLITVKGKRLIERCRYCLYAGSLVPETVVGVAPDGAEVVDTAALTLDDIMEIIARADAEGEDVARVHSGDPSLYGATAEQIRRGRVQDCPWRSRFRGSGRRNGGGVDYPGGGSKHRSDPDSDEVLGHAGGRGTRELRPHRSNARYPPVNPKSTGG